MDTPDPFGSPAQGTRDALGHPTPILGSCPGDSDPTGMSQTCVRAGVALQLVGAREALAAEHPVADEGALARVQPHVRPQQRRLAERPPALGDVADVLLLPGIARPEWRGGVTQGEGEPQGWAALGEEGLARERRIWREERIQERWIQRDEVLWVIPGEAEPEG